MSQLAMLLPTRPPARPSGPAATAAARFRTATAADDEGLAALLGAAFPEQKWGAARVERELTGAADVSHVFVLDDAGVVTATASARHGVAEFPGMGYVHWVGVRPEARGRSLGRAATLRVVEHFAAGGPWPVVLTTDDERLPAISTYLGLGFIPHYVDDDHRERWSQVFVALRDARTREGRP